MRRLITVILCLLTLSSPILLSSCVTTPTTQSQSIPALQSDAVKAVVVMGNVLETAPQMLLDARHAQLLSKEQFNYAVDIYNQALGSYSILNKVLQGVVQVGGDPNKSEAYLEAFDKFVNDKGLLNDIIHSIGGVI